MANGEEVSRWSWIWKVAIEGGEEGLWWWMKLSCLPCQKLASLRLSLFPSPMEARSSPSLLGADLQFNFSSTIARPIHLNPYSDKLRRSSPFFLHGYHNHFKFSVKFRFSSFLSHHFNFVVPSIVSSTIRKSTRALPSSNQKRCSGGTGHDEGCRWFQEVAHGLVGVEGAQEARQSEWERERVTLTKRQVTIKQMKGNMRRHAHVEVLLEIKELMERNWCIRVAWIHTEANFPADWLARQGAASVDHGLTELANSRPELNLLLLKDRLAVP